MEFLIFRFSIFMSLIFSVEFILNVLNLNLTVTDFTFENRIAQLKILNNFGIIYYKLGKIYNKNNLNT